MVTLAAGAIPKTASLPKQINKSLNSWYAVIDLESAFFYLPVNKSSLLSAEKASNVPSLSYLKGIITPKP